MCLFCLTWTVSLSKSNGYFTEVHRSDSSSSCYVELTSVLWWGRVVCIRNWKYMYMYIYNGKSVPREDGEALKP